MINQQKNHLSNQPCGQMMTIPHTQAVQNTNCELEIGKIIKEILTSAQQKIKYNAILRNLPQYVNQGVSEKINQVSEILFLQFETERKYYNQTEPKPLLVDSLLPISADIDQENQYKKRLTQPTIMSDSQFFSPKATVKEVFKQTFNVKLPGFPQYVEDGFTSELRKNAQQNHQRRENEKKERQNKEKISKQKGKEDKNRQQNVSYDYSGKMIQLKIESKANLIQKFINSQTQKQGKVTKQVSNDPNPTVLKGQKPGKKQIKFTAVVQKKKEDVQFSDVRSLAQHVRTTVGVKYTHQGKTIEQKQRQTTTHQIKKTLSQRRLSKEQFIRIKQLNSNHQDLSEKLRKDTLKNSPIDDEEIARSDRAQSESKLPGSRFRSKNMASIHVQNQGLKFKLLEPAPKFEYLKSAPQNQEKETEQKPSLMGTIDNFNIDYIRTGGSLQTNTSRQFYSNRDNLQLPKITHTTLYSKGFPKGRQRIKDSNQIMRQIRKKFQDRLRV